MIKRLLLILVLLFIMMSCICVVNAEQITMNVSNKHIIGTGTGYSPLTPDDFFYSVVYIVSEMKDGCIVQEYPVSAQDYYKIRIGQTITLESPVNGIYPCKIIKIE